LNVTPVLLLDDIFDKLDQSRVRKLLELVSNHYFGQVIVTDTDEERMREIFQGGDFETRMFKVDEGVVEELTNSLKGIE
jgi:DNA replication and repair protein RecF